MLPPYSNDGVDQGDAGNRGERHAEGCGEDVAHSGTPRRKDWTGRGAWADIAAVLYSAAFERTLLVCGLLHVPALLGAPFIVVGVMLSMFPIGIAGKIVAGAVCLAWLIAPVILRRYWWPETRAFVAMRWRMEG